MNTSNEFFHVRVLQSVLSWKAYLIHNHKRNSKIGSVIFWFQE